MKYIGITERGDAALDTSWKDWVSKGEKAILITKHFTRLKVELEQFINSGEIDPKNIIVHATVTGMAGSWLEPNVHEPHWDWINSAKSELGLADFVLRVDPIIPVKEGIDIALSVIEKYKPIDIAPRVRISFIDYYNHVKDRGLNLPWTTLHAPLKLRQDAYYAIKHFCDNKGFNLEICSEPGFECTGCVSFIDLKAFGVQDNPEYNMSLNTGYQRPDCKCLSIKKKLLKSRHPCRHKCIYCYWKD